MALLSTVSRSNWNLEMLVFVEGGKPEYPEKNPRSRDENQQQTQPTYDAETGNRTRATLVGGECSHHCAIPAPNYLSVLALFYSCFFCRKLFRHFLPVCAVSFCCSFFSYPAASSFFPCSCTHVNSCCLPRRRSFGSSRNLSSPVKDCVTSQKSVCKGG